MALTDVQGGGAHTVSAEVTVRPADVADDAEWLNVTAWQGDGLVVDRLERVGPAATAPPSRSPCTATEALIRLHSGNSLMVAPLFLPRTRPSPRGGAGPGSVRADLRDRPHRAATRAEVRRACAHRHRLRRGHRHRAVPARAPGLGLHRLGTPPGERRPPPVARARARGCEPHDPARPTCPPSRPRGLDQTLLLRGAPALPAARETIAALPESSRPCWCCRPCPSSSPSSSGTPKCCRRSSSGWTASSTTPPCSR